LAVQVTEGDDYYLGRVLINAQIAAGYALTVRLRRGYVFYGHAYGCPKNAIGVLVDTAAHALTTIQFADSLVQKSLVASKKFELIILLG
jgi:hypothetical protein